MQIPVAKGEMNKALRMFLILNGVSINPESLEEPKELTELIGDHEDAYIWFHCWPPRPILRPKAERSHKPRKICNVKLCLQRFRGGGCLSHAGSDPESVFRVIVGE